MPSIHLNHISLYYETQGHGVPIVFVAGFNVDHHCWDPIVDECAKIGQTLVFDHRGTGRSDCPDVPYSIEMMANDVLALCDALDLERCHFIGASMGVGIVLYLAHHHPERCRTLVLSNGFTQIDPRFLYFANTQVKLLESGAEPSLIAKLSWPWIFSTAFLTKPGVLDLLNSALAESPPLDKTGSANQLHALSTLDNRPLLNQIQTPTLVIGSNQDLIVPESEIRFLANHLPNADYYCFTGIGHAPHIEAPETFNDIVQKFYLKTIA